MKSIIAILSALGQQTRLEVLTLLGRGPVEGLTSGDLAMLARVPANSMSTHLAILAAAGLVSATRNGRKVTYCIERQAVEGALDNLSARLDDQTPKTYTGTASWKGVTPLAEPDAWSLRTMQFASPIHWSGTPNLRAATGNPSGQDVGSTPPGYARLSNFRSRKEHTRSIDHGSASR